jgi:DNA-binding transcriptional MerR regulator
MKLSIFHWIDLAQKMFDINVTSRYKLYLGGGNLEYTINDIAKIAGISTRTLRYYDEINLLSPKRISSNGYRIYGKEEINQLQQVLFYREFDIKLDKIAELIKRNDFDRESALIEHRTNLMTKRKQIDDLIQNLDESLDEMRGRTIMKDMDKFKGFKEEKIKENEKNYGKEIREKYGDEVIEESNKKYMDQTKEQFERAEALSKKILSRLYLVMDEGEPASEDAQEVAKLHQEWLMLYWPVYSKEAHRGLAQMYVDDERFTKFYDDGKKGAAEYLKLIIDEYTK